jgi:hypothetical protein
LDVGQVPALLVDGQKPLRLGGRGIEGFPLEDDDRPGKNREKEEDEENGLDDEAGVHDELENIHDTSLQK